MRNERPMIHEPLGDAPHERVCCRLNVELEASCFCVSERSVPIEMLPNYGNLVRVHTNETPRESDLAHATLSGSIAATVSRNARRSIRSS